ncbi:MAG: PilT/PilU family type 4a pilus ATPase [Xanthomonadaceae bacterium]|nr:PilT/PilU family type 4a pilus ATPase [Xanthomonadaceae bacterium]
MDISPYFRLMVEKEASDLFIYPGAPISIKLNGRVRPLGSTPLSPQAVQEIVYSLLREDQIKEFEQELELNTALRIEDIGRFRANVFRQRGEFGLVIRYVKSDIPEIEDLNLPPVLKDLVMEKRGLILVVGATGSGKSTTLASMIDYRASSTTGHILTIEDPIEFVYEHKLSIIGQREVGLDTHSYETALESAMREAPDVILVGEVRNRTVMRATLNFSITGHLCLTTLHAKNAASALDRIVNFFPEDARPQLLMDLSLNIKAIISQRLVRGLDGKLVPAVEVMLNTPYIAELIQKGKLEIIGEAMENGGTTGMRTFDQALYQLYSEGKISAEEAISQADSKNNLALRIRMTDTGALNENQVPSNLRLQGKRNRK